VQSIFIFITLPVFLVAGCAMFMMWINGIKAGDLTGYTRKGYNLKYFRIFRVSILTLITIGIVFNVLLLLGYIKV
jgi:hypothetical protein